MTSLDLLAEGAVRRRGRRGRRASSRASSSPTRSVTGFEASAVVAGVDAERPAVGRQLLDVEERQAVGREDLSTVAKEK